MKNGIEMSALESLICRIIRKSGLDSSPATDSGSLPALNGNCALPQPHVPPRASRDNIFLYLERWSKFLLFTHECAVENSGKTTGSIHCFQAFVVGEPS